MGTRTRYIGLNIETTLTFEIGVHIRLFIFRKSAALYDTIRVYTFIIFVANPPYSIRFLFGLCLLAAQYFKSSRVKSEVYSPFIAQSHAWRRTLLEFQETVICQPTCHLGRDRFASSGRAFGSAGSRIISFETIDQTETRRRWLTTFTFLRLQLKSYNGQHAYKVTNKFKLLRKLPRCDVWIWRPPITKIVRPIISEKSVMGRHCKSTDTFTLLALSCSVEYFLLKYGIVQT